MWEEIVKTLGLEPLTQEGGLYKSSYRSKEMLDGNNIASAIYFMLKGDAFSHLHKLSTDEIYHFYKGDSVELLCLYPDGISEVITLGSDITNGEQVQYVVKAGVWQGSRLKDGGTYALMGTTMAPGYREDDYIHALRDDLISSYPEREELIKKLTGKLTYF